MKEAEFLALPDAQKNALVAEKVMGWTPWRSPCVKPGDPNPDCWKTGEEYNPTHTIDGWNPITDWEDAGRVVRKVQERGYWIQMTCSQRTDSCSIGKGHEVLVRVKHLPFSLAVSLAALKVLGAVVNDPFEEAPPA